MLLDLVGTDQTFTAIDPRRYVITSDFTSETSTTHIRRNYWLETLQAEIDPSAIEPIAVQLRASLNQDAKRMLGPTTLARYYSFMFLRDGWDGGDAKGISARSTETLNAFASLHPMISNPVSLFLTDRGYLEILFKNSDGKSINIEFMPDGLEYFHEGLMVEGEVPTAEMGKFISSIN